MHFLLESHALSVKVKCCRSRNGRQTKLEGYLLQQISTSSNICHRSKKGAVGRGMVLNYPKPQNIPWLNSNEKMNLFWQFCRFRGTGCRLRLVIIKCSLCILETFPKNHRFWKGTASLLGLKANYAMHVLGLAAENTNLVVAKEK